MEIDKAIIVIKKSNTRYIDVLNKFIGTYPNISIYSTMDFYPNGWERLVVKNTLGISYDKYSKECYLFFNLVKWEIRIGWFVF